MTIVYLRHTLCCNLLFSNAVLTSLLMLGAKLLNAIVKGMEGAISVLKFRPCGLSVLHCFIQNCSLVSCQEIILVCFHYFHGFFFTC